MKKILSLFLFCSLFSGASFSQSQLDSVVVSVTFTQEIDSTSLDSVLVPMDFMTANVWVNDPLLVGNIVVSVYEVQSGHPMARAHFNLAQLQATGVLTGNTFSIPLGFLDSTLSYDIKTLVQNFQLAYLPEIVISYP